MWHLPVVVDGDCDSRFEHVKQTFCSNFVDGWENEGAAFAVYLNGEKVVDLWGGYADSSSKKKWKMDTMSLIFSTTKSVCAISFALLVDRGLVAYEDLVTKFWPEFGQNGKDMITFDMILSYQAGLAYLDGVIEEADLRDWTRMSKIFEQQAPVWVPGQCMGYHAFTIGWLVDQFVRRIDPKKRSVAQFFHEEIAVPHDIDLLISAPPELEYRIARIAKASKVTAAREIVQYPSMIKTLCTLTFSSVTTNGILNKIINNLKWIGNSVLVYNNAEYRSLYIPAALGVSTARALAKLCSLVVSGKLLKESTIKQLQSPLVVDQPDIVLSMELSVGRGFHFSKTIQGEWMIGHPGMGGQNAKMDFNNKVAFAYICNGLKCGMGDRVVTFMRLQNALYQCLNDNNLLTQPITPALSATENQKKRSTSDDEKHGDNSKLLLEKGDAEFNAITEK